MRRQKSRVRQHRRPKRSWRSQVGFTLVHIPLQNGMLYPQKILRNAYKITTGARHAALYHHEDGNREPTRGLIY
jgi:hypothetical protein